MVFEHGKYHVSKAYNNKKESIINILDKVIPTVNDIWHLKHVLYGWYGIDARITTNTISFRFIQDEYSDNSKRIRGDKLGDEYTVHAIEERIAECKKIKDLRPMINLL